MEDKAVYASMKKKDKNFLEGVDSKITLGSYKLPEVNRNLNSLQKQKQM